MGRVEILEGLRRMDVPGLVSASLTGSFIRAKRLGLVEDIDVYLIFDAFDAERFRKTVVFFRNLCRKLSTAHYEFRLEMRGGAFKPHKGKRKVVQFHVIVNTVDMIPRKSPMVALDWSRHSFHLKGKRAKELICVNRFSKKDLIEGKDGLLHFLRILESGMMSWTEWKEEGECMLRVHMEKEIDPDEWPEMLQFVVLTGFMNYIRLENPGFRKTVEGLLKEAGRLPANHRELVEDIASLKQNIKSHGRTEVDVDSVRARAKGFIRYLIETA